MAEKADYLKAFDEAVLYFNSDWSPALPDQRAITVDRTLRSIREVCAFVDGFDDPIPDDLYRALCFKMHLGSDALKEKLGKNSTYATAASCLLEMLERRVAAYPPSP